MADAGQSKLDAGLFHALRAWESAAGAAPDAGITISLHFEGALADLEALGFETSSSSEGEARGVVRFKDVAKLAAHPGVVWMAAGQSRRADLEIGPRDIRARASTSANTDGLWHADETTGALTQSGNATGAGVIVAVIDTGIDFTHPMFMSQVTPTKVTRILRIWDQGLRPTALTECPDVALLQGPHRYGVEYDSAKINTALNGGAAVLHQDCEGHGTHVAGIAAGGTKFAPVAAGNAKRVGVAPEADIIAVKLLDAPSPINPRTAAGFSAVEMGWSDRFRDAVLYCLRTAKNLGKPIVINMSFGNSQEPGDGLDDDARWLDGVMDPAQAADANHFPTGAIVVKSSGNDGDAARRMVARIVMPAAGTITIPLEVVDNHGPLHTKWRCTRTGCDNVLHSPTLFASFWYRRNFDNVKFAVKFPFRTSFGGDMGVGGNFDHGFIVRPGAPPQLVFVAPATNVHTVTFSHGGEAAVPHPAGGTVRRHQAWMAVRPKVSSGNVSYLTGIYEVRITAPANTELFFVGDVSGWGGPGLVAFLRVANKLADGSALDPVVAGAVTSEYSIGDGLGRHAITVAAYDDQNTVGNVNHPIANFSSRGPMRDYSDPARPPIATKPDLAAPGVKIESAEGVDTNVGAGIRVPPWTDGVRFVEKGGTSMSAPMITGLVALMLDKNATLSTNDVRTILTGAAAGRPGTNPAAPGTAHDRAYGSGMAAARESHTSTP